MSAPETTLPKFVKLETREKSDPLVVETRILMLSELLRNMLAGMCELLCRCSYMRLISRLRIRYRSGARWRSHSSAKCDRASHEEG